MLDTRTPQRSRVLRARSAPTTRLPHPSWRRPFDTVAPGKAAAIGNAGDFWSRLGL